MTEEDGCSSMMEPQFEAGETAADGMISTADSISCESGQNKTDKVDLESNVELEEDVRDFNLRQEDVVRQGLFSNYCCSFQPCS